MASRFEMPRYCKHDIEYRIYDGVDVNLMVLCEQRVDSQTVISCLRIEDVEQFLREDTLLQTYGKSLERNEPYEALRGELCIVKLSSGIWRRACYMEPNGSVAEVYAIDYGIVYSVSLKDIRVNIKYSVS